MRGVIKKAIYGQKETGLFHILTQAAVFGAGLYLSSVLWYAVNKSGALELLGIDGFIFACALLAPVVMIICIYPTTNVLYFDRNIEYLLYYPVKPEIILKTVLFNNFFKLIITTLIVYLPVVFWRVPMRLNWFFCVALTYFAEFFAVQAFVILTMLSVRILPKKIAAFAAAAEQYLYLLVSGFAVSLLHTKKPGVLTGSFWTGAAVLILFAAGSTALYFLSPRLCRRSFVQAYSKTSGLQSKSGGFHKTREKANKIRDVYLFLECRQLFRNKQLLFRAALRGVMTAAVMPRLLGTAGVNAAWIIVSGVIAASNNISSVAYSKDMKDIKSYAVLPLDAAKLTLCKIFVSFAVNQAVVVIFICYASVNMDIPVPLRHLSLYATCVNLICSAAGVLLDYKSASESGGENDISSGNMNRIIVLLLAAVKIAADAVICRRLYLLHMVNLLIIVILYIKVRKIKQFRFT
jgi:hypothetical protein